jgi:hypothetical protein
MGRAPPGGHSSISFGNEPAPSRVPPGNRSNQNYEAPQQSRAPPGGYSNMGYGNEMPQQSRAPPGGYSSMNFGNEPPQQSRAPPGGYSQNNINGGDYGRQQNATPVNDKKSQYARDLGAPFIFCVDSKEEQMRLKKERESQQKAKILEEDMRARVPFFDLMSLERT